MEEQAKKEYTYEDIKKLENRLESLKAANNQINSIYQKEVGQQEERVGLIKEKNTNERRKHRVS